MDETRYINSFSKIIGLKTEDVISYIEKKGMAALIYNADELLETKEQREKHKAFLDLYRMSEELNRNNPQLNSPERVVSFMHSVMPKIHDKEAFIVAYLDNKLKVLGYDEVSEGTINGTDAHAREVFRGAIINKASSIIIAHNHPSGDVTPSAADFMITARLEEAGKLLDIPVNDHVIVTGLNQRDYFSFAQNNLIKSQNNKSNIAYDNITDYTLKEDGVSYSAENISSNTTVKPDKNLFARWQIERIFTKDSDAYFLSVKPEDIGTVKDLFSDFKLKDGNSFVNGFNFPTDSEKITIKFYIDVSREEYRAEITDEYTDSDYADTLEDLTDDIDWHYNDENTLTEFARSFENSDTGITNGERIIYNGIHYTAGWIFETPISSTKRLHLVPDDASIPSETVRFIGNDELFDKIDIQKKNQDNYIAENNKQEGNDNTLNIPGEKLSPKDLLSKRLEDGIKEIISSDNFKYWLDTSSRLFTKNYSLRNALLVYLQKPEASYTMGYEKWKEYGRNVSQGAKAAQIFIPVMAYEKTKGAMYRMIISNLRNQIKQNPEKTAVYKVGTSKCEFTMNNSGQIGLRFDGKERAIFPNHQDMKKFISNAILGKVPMYYSIGSVFDLKDTIIPEHLWVKTGFTDSEVVRDKYGNPIKNSKGETKIINTPERQAKFNPKLDFSIIEKEPEKMKILYDCLKAVSKRNGVPVTDVKRENDEILKNGADGYFSREYSAENPKGFIMMPDDLEPTRKCAVLLHEMGHSDLHGNLENLAKEMGEKDISHKMKEIQAEAVSYATAKQFGIETDTSSFQYLAAYSSGFDLQDLKKSLDLIYNECRRLTSEIAAELQLRNLSLDLDEIQAEPIELKALETLSNQYSSYAQKLTEENTARKKEFPSLAAANRSNTDLLDIIKDQKHCTDRMEIIIQAINDNVQKLQDISTRTEQDEIIDTIEILKRQSDEENKTFSMLSESFSEIMSKQKQSLKDEFWTQPSHVIDKLKHGYPELDSLSELQLSYICKSDFIRTEFAHLMDGDKDKFVKEICKRAEAINGVISKSGAFIEIKLCEQRTDSPIVLRGALLHPKCADNLIKHGESVIRKLRSDSEKSGGYFPYSKCRLTLFVKSIDKASFEDFNTRIDIGDGNQKSLSDHLELFLMKNGIFMSAFNKSLLEKEVSEKIAFNEEKSDENPASDKSTSDTLSLEKWQAEISESKANIIKEDFPDKIPLSNSKPKAMFKES